MTSAHRVGKFVISKSGWCTPTSLSVTHNKQVLPWNSSGCIVSAPIERSNDLPIEGRSPTTGLSQNTIDLTQIENRIMINLCKHLWWEKISTIQPSSYSIHSIHSEFYWINNNLTNFLPLYSIMHACISIILVTVSCIPCYSNTGILTLPNLCRTIAITRNFPISPFSFNPWRNHCRIELLIVYPELWSQS